VLRRGCDSRPVATRPGLSPSSDSKPRRRQVGRVRVAVDAAQLGVRGKGIARYLIEILPELALAAGELEVVVLTPDEVQLPPGAEALARCGIQSRPAIVWEQIRLPRLAKSAGFGLLHTLTDRLPIVGSPPSVVYLFEDPRYRVSAAHTTAGLKKKAADSLTTTLFPRTLQRADLILAGSESTRRDVLARGIDEARVRVVYPGVGPSFRPPRDEGELLSIRSRLGRPDGFVLHFSSDDPRDNSRVALESYAAMIERLPGAPELVVVGSVSAQLPAQQALAGRLGIRDRISWLGYRPDAEVSDLYRGASAYLDPSLYEGFGFQVAEALASGVPVVCSNTTSLPEVVGDAGLLVAPTDVRGFAEALAVVLEERELSLELRSRGPVQAGRFRWARTAEQTVAAWRWVLGENRRVSRQ
jgi:glycosyltransferase involved in cell wall biosynthesis